MTLSQAGRRLLGDKNTQSIEILSDPGAKAATYESHRNTMASDLHLKVRDLQLQLIDMQGTQERRLAILNEQLTAKIDRAIATFE